MKKLFKKICFYLLSPIWIPLAIISDTFCFWLIEKGWFD